MVLKYNWRRQTKNNKYRKKTEKICFQNKNKKRKEYMKKYLKEYRKNQSKQLLKKIIKKQWVAKCWANAATNFTKDEIESFSNDDSDVIVDVLDDNNGDMILGFR